MQELPLHGGVGGQEGEHRSHIGVNHAGTLGDAAQEDLPPAYFKAGRYLLGAGVGSHNRPRHVCAAVVGKLNLLHAGANQGHRQFHANYSGTAYQHLLRRSPGLQGGEGGHLHGVNITLLPNAGVGDAGVDNQGPHGNALGQPLPVNGDARRLDRAGGKHSGGGARTFGQENRQVQLVLGKSLQPSVSGAGAKTQGGGYGSAVNKVYCTSHGMCPLTKSGSFNWQKV